MLCSREGRRRVICVAFLPLLAILASLVWATPAQGQGGFALSGSFYAQDFELPQGSILRAPDVYVVVFNNTDSDLDVRMTTETPLGVRLILSEDDFPLKAGEQKRVEVGVQVTSEAAPGEYEMGVTAEPYREGATGIQILGAAGQRAKLVVVGEGAQVIGQVVNPAGDPVAGVIRLFRIAAGKRYEVAYSDTGNLEVTVAPGSYAASAYMAGEELAEQSFEVAADEEKIVTLTVRTVYFEGFGLVPNTHTETGDLAFAQIVYTVKNLYQRVERAKVVLQVSLDGAPLDEVSLATLNPLEMGQVGLSYNYIPADGWREGSYGFRLALLLDGKPYATTLEELLSVGEQRATPAAEESAPTNWGLIGGAAVAVLAIAGAGYALLARRRGRKEHRA